MYRLLICFCFLPTLFFGQQVCNPAGNLVIYGNYDGGTLNINVDEDIPNLYIGLVSYEHEHVTISGPFVENVAGVFWAGYGGTNNHCAQGPPFSTTIDVVGSTSAEVDIAYSPQNVITGTGLPSSISSGYACSTPGFGSSYSSPEQLVAYFSQFGAMSLRFSLLQYGCWNGGGYAISEGGSCCEGALPDVPGCTDAQACNFNAEATVDDGSCQYPGNSGGCTDTTACNYEADALEDDGSCHYFCQGCLDEGACNFDPNATVNNGSCTYDCLGCTYSFASNYDPTATRDDGSCLPNCQPDLDADGFVTTGDLLIFLAFFATACDE